MAKLLRGEIRWANLNPVRGSEQGGLRPVLILSQDTFNERSGTVIALAITVQLPLAQFPLTFEIKCKDIPKRSWVKISQIRTLANERVGKKISQISSEDLAKIMDGFNEIIGN
jgi:mRNA interferase MazF